MLSVLVAISKVPRSLFCTLELTIVTEVVSEVGCVCFLFVGFFLRGEAKTIKALLFVFCGDGIFCIVYRSGI